MGLQNNKILGLISVIGLFIVGFYIYYYTPQACAYRYVLAYNRADFEKVFSYYKKEAVMDKFSKEEVIAVLQGQAQVRGKMTAKELTLVKDKKTKKWFVKFPYSLESIFVSAPTGASVYINGKKIVEKMTGEGIEIKDLLPGKHHVTLEYYQQMYPTFTQTINLPQETRVESPYQTYDICFFTLAGSWVQMGDVIKQNTDGKVTFKRMLPGQYDISIFTQDKEIEIFSKKVQIDPTNTTIHIEKIKANDKLKEDVIDFFKGFNSKYKLGIIGRDPSFLQDFLADKINKDVISDFEAWYIHNKDITDAKSLMEVRDVYPISGNELKTSVLETVYLTNLEKDPDGKEIQEEYRVVIEWNYKLSRKDSSWQIGERKILQSIVAYKNEEDKWIKD